MKELKLTTLDMHYLNAIKQCGFVGLDAGRRPYLESSVNITPYRLDRLARLGLVVSNGDNLIPGMPPQSYRPA